VLRVMLHTPWRGRRSGSGRVQAGARALESASARGARREWGVWDFSMRRCPAIGGAYLFPVIRATLAGLHPGLTRW